MIKGINNQEEDVLIGIEKISPEAGEYFRLFVDMIDEFEVEPYKNSPEQVLNCFSKGLDEDQNELIGVLEDEIANSSDPDYSRGAIIDALKLFLVSLNDRKVVLWALKPIFEHFKVTPEKASPLDRKVRFRMPNLLTERSELSIFFVKCGLVCDPGSSKGSHEKWTDPRNEMKGFTNITSSNKIWLKNVIKELLEKDMPVERIKDACDMLDIDFVVL